MKHSVYTGVACGAVVMSCGGSASQASAMDVMTDGGGAPADGGSVAQDASSDGGIAVHRDADGSYEFMVRNLIDEESASDGQGHTIDVQVCGMPPTDALFPLFRLKPDIALVQLIDLYGTSYCVSVATKLASGEETTVRINPTKVRKLSKGRLVVWISHSNQYSPVPHPCWVYPRPFEPATGPDATIGYTIDVTAVHRASYTCGITDVSADDEWSARPQSSR